MKKAYFVLLMVMLSNFAMAESQLDIDKLIEELNNENWSIRMKSAVDLGKTKDCSVIRPLINALNDENYYVRKWAANALIQIGKPSFDLLTVSLGDIAWRVRKRAAYALGEINDDNAVSFLINALRDRNPYVVNAAKNALIKIGVPAIDSVIALLNDRDIDVQKNAGYILAEIGTPSIEPLIDVLKDSNWYISVETIWILGEIGDSHAIEPLLFALKDENNLVRWEAISALGKMGDERILEFIKPMLKDEDGHIRDIAKEVIERLKNNDRKEFSITALKK